MNKSKEFAAFAVIVFFLNFLSYSGLAQSEEEDEAFDNRIFYAGVVAGANFAQVDGDNFAGYYKKGLNVGGIGYVKLKKHLALSWEILYSQMGSKSDVIRKSSLDTAVFITNYGISVNYASIPVLINYFDNKRSHVGLGIAYNRLVSGTENVTTIPAYNVDLTKYPFKKDCYDFIANADLHCWKGLFLNLRFQYSIVPMRSDVPPGFSRAKEYNNVWTVRLMYLFF